MSTSVDYFIFKLNYDGTFSQVAYENIKEVFSIVNILAIYLIKKKTMYIWIGRNATQSLKNHISNIRVLVKEEFPDFRIIRNNTYEMREEPFEFFQNLNLTKEELYKQIEYQEKVMLPTLRKIDGLKKKLEKFIELEDYNETINISEEIIKLATEINDGALLTEQKSLITELKTKSEDKKLINDINNKTSEVEIEFSKLIEVKEYLQAHKIVEDFEKEYSSIYDLTLVPNAKELISKEKEIWKKEQDHLDKILNKLENDLFLALKNLEIETATRLMKKGKSLFKNFVNDEIKKKWNGFESNLEIAIQKNEVIQRVDKFILEFNDLKKNHQFKVILEHIGNFLTETQKFNIKDYSKKLEDLRSDANSAEDFYKTKISEIDELEKIIKNNQKANLIDDLQKNCEMIIQIAQLIDKPEVEKKYSVILEQAENEIEKRRIFEAKQSKVKKELEQLETNFGVHMKTMDLIGAGKIIDKSKIFLVELVDDEIKKNWDLLEKKHLTGRNLIENVEQLSKNGLNALNERSYNVSLESYEKIINQLQEYEK